MGAPRLSATPVVEHCTLTAEHPGSRMASSLQDLVGHATAQPAPPGLLRLLSSQEPRRRRRAAPPCGQTETMRFADPPRGCGEQALVGLRKAGVPKGSAAGGGLRSGASWIDE